MDRVFAAVSALLLACHEPEDDSADDTGDDVPLSIPDMPSSLEVAATDGSLATDFALGVSGAGSDDVGAIALADNVGTVTLDGAAVAGVAFVQIPWESFDQTLYQGFAVASDRWDVFWLYCQGGTSGEEPLAYVYSEGIGGPPLHGGPGSGTCAAALVPTVASFSLPALHVDLPDPPAGYSIAGEDLALEDGGTGALRLHDEAVPFSVFEVVDCTLDCGSPGWTELHAVLWDDPEAIFVILYLLENDPEGVLLAYARALPSFEDPIGTTTLPATWTVPQPQARRGRPAAFVPPPGAR